MKSTYLSLIIVLFLVACSNQNDWNSINQNKQIILTSDNKELKFHITKSISESYQILSFDLAKNKIEKDNAVIITFWGIPLDKVSEDKPFSKNDLSQAKIFNIISANTSLHDELISMAKNKKGCWKKVTITGEHMIKIEEDNKASNLDLNFFYLREIIGSW